MSINIDDLEALWDARPHSLLPRDQTKLDHAQELADAARYPLPFGAVVRCKDPYVCDPRVLPFLAWERSVDLWKSNWTLAQKRFATAQAFPMQRKKGTAYGIKLYTAMMGGNTLLIEAPPLMAFPGRDQTPAERTQWLSQFPQLRLYPYATYGFSQLALFSTEQKVVALDGAPSPPWITVDSIAPDGVVEAVEAFYPVPDEADIPEINYPLYMGNTTVLYDPVTGASTEMDFFTTQVQGADGTFTEYNQVVLPGSTEDCWFAGDDPTDASGSQVILMVDDTTGALVATGEIGFFATSLNLVAVRSVTSLQNNPPVGYDPDLYTASTVTPGLAPISVYPDTIYNDAPTLLGDWYGNHFPTIENLYAPSMNATAFVVDGTWGYFPIADRAALNIYSVLYLYNPTDTSAPQILPPWARCFADHDYIQYPAYTAQATVEIFSTLYPCDLGFYWGDGYLTDVDYACLWDVVTAVRAAQSARDLVWVNTATYGIATPNAATVCGVVACGAQVPVLNV